MDFKYKPGDQVQVQANAFYKDDKYHMSSGPLTDKLAENTVTISERTIDIRNSLLGKIVTIEGYAFNRYVIKECRHTVLWTDDMFIGLANENECCCESLL